MKDKDVILIVLFLFHNNYKLDDTEFRRHKLDFQPIYFRTA